MTEQEFFNLETGDYLKDISNNFDIKIIQDNVPKNGTDIIHEIIYDDHKGKGWERNYIFYHLGTEKIEYLYDYEFEPPNIHKS